MDTSFFFQPRRPNTSHLTTSHLTTSHPNTIQQDAAIRLKVSKIQADRHKQEYTQMIRRLTQTQKLIDSSLRESQKTKVMFLNLYENRKMKMIGKQLLQEKESREQKAEREKKEMAKHARINSEVRLMITKSEAQQANKLNCSRNKQAKQAIRLRQKDKSNEYLAQARRSYLQVKSRQSALQQRKKMMSRVRAERAKSDYMLRMKWEMQNIEVYDRMIALREREGEQLPSHHPSCQSLFVTEHQNLSPQL